MSDNKFQRKPKRPPALWRTIQSPGFQAQAAQIHPERAAHGGMSAISASKKVRDAVYREIAILFKLRFPFCETCVAIRKCKAGQARETSDVHHKRGKTGLLLFDVRHFIPVCRPCHIWIGENIKAARALGMICEKGEWNKEAE